MLKRKKIDSLYLLSLHIAFVKNNFTQKFANSLRGSSTETGHGMAVINLTDLLLLFTNLHVISEKVIHASFDTLFYILNLACKDLQQSHCRDVLRCIKSISLLAISFKMAY